MAHFDERLRTELRDDLIKTVGTALRDELPKAMQHAMIDMVDGQVFDAIDRTLDRFLNSDDMDCWLSFSADGPEILIGLGPGDCAASFEPELTLDFCQHDNITREQEQDILDQIAGIRHFMAKLDQSLRVLEARAKVFTGRVHALPEVRA